MSARPSPPQLPPALGVAARVVVGAALVYAGAHKAAGPAEEFALVIGAYQMLPPDATQFVAVVLPWAELLVGWSLILGFQLRLAAGAALAMFGGFLLGLLNVQLRGIELANCGCFGDAVHFTPLQAMLVDLCLSGLAFLAWKSAPAKLSLDSWSERGL